jgi:two-component system response regulator RegA
MAESEPAFLVVDDDRVFRERLARALRERGYDVREAEDAAAARSAVAATAIGWAVVDLRLPDGSGLDVVRDVVSAAPRAKVVVLTGYGSIATALEAVRLGAAHYLTKPASVEEVLAGLTRDAPAQPETEAEAPDDVPSLARVEWEHINRVLADSGGNISEAARRLGMHRRSLQRKLSKRPTRR